MKRKFRTGHLDANESALFLRGAEHIIAQLYNVEYPQYKALQLIPISREGGPGARSITYRQFNQVGMAKVVNNYATDFPRVDVMGKEYTQTVKSLGDSYGWNVQEIREADRDGIPLDSMRARVAQEAMLRKMNRIGWFGESEAGLKGLIYHPNITKAQATVGTWGSATAEQILADVNNAIQGVKTLTKDVEYVDTVLLPSAKYAQLATKVYSAENPVFLLKILQEGNPGVLFAPVAELASLAINPRTGGAGPVHVMICYRRDPMKLFLSIPQDFEQFPPENKGMEWVVNCHARIAGVISPYPLSAVIVDGI